ncbi:MAG TPA: DUF4491 family protein [Anaerolineales bacterium]|nr:DUF4491 family protein [Anaerolineales bacterium]
MDINWLGLASAFATFFGVWIGHVSVRKIEREVVRIWIPTTLSLLLGVGLMFASFLNMSLIFSTICGILAVTLFWDALEFGVRQPNRIKHGHAPANPNNPRHAQILTAYPKATTVDLLERDPRGVPYAEEEIKSMKESAQ